MRDEGTSYHYAAPSQYGEADPELVAAAAGALKAQGLRGDRRRELDDGRPVPRNRGSDRSGEGEGILAVEMEAAALYTFAKANQVRVLCLAHVTNTMAQTGADFEKGDAAGTSDALAVLAAIAGAVSEEQ